MLMVLALTGIVVAVSWSVYSHFHLFGLQYNKRNGDTHELLMLDLHLRSDARNAAECSLGEGKLVFYAREHRLISNYVMDSTFFLRTTTEDQDTFFVKFLQLDSVAGVGEMQLQLAVGFEENPMRLRYTVRYPASARSASSTRSAGP